MSGEVGPLSGVRVLEIAGIGPAPFGVMMLADLGAEVIRVDRIGGAGADYTPNPVLERGRRSIALDLKSLAGIRVLLDLVAGSDVLVEGFRPGVMERLGAGPDDCLTVNPTLVYGRVSGWGQQGPYAMTAGHDINYIGLTGALHAMGDPGSPPSPPLNLVGDFGGAGMQLAYGVLAALTAVARGGAGRVVDANVFDATATLLALVHGLDAQGRWNRERGSNLLDGSRPFYRVYTCADGGWMAFGAIEERFYRNALEVLGLAGDPELLAGHKNPGAWPRLQHELERVFRARTRDEWTALFDGVESCVTPVLDLDEAAAHPHAQARGSYVQRGSVRHPAVAPRFGEHPVSLPVEAPAPGEHGEEILRELGYDGDRIDRLREEGALG